MHVYVDESKYLPLYDEAQKMKRRLATVVSCDGEMQQRLFNEINDVLGYIDTLHSKVMKSQHTVKMLFCGSIELLIQCFWTIFRQNITAFSKYVDKFGCQVLVELCRSIPECEAAAKGYLDRILNGELAFI